LCKNVEEAERLFGAVVEHAKDAWEKNEVYIQRNQMSTCLQRYDVPTFFFIFYFLFLFYNVR
jgi:hypothetical protein